MKKVSLLLAAFALVIGLSQCKKPNLPVLNIGETQHVVINASWDNGGAKIDQNGTLFKWTIGDKLTVSGGATGELTCTDADNSIFEGTITKNTGAEITFTFGSKTYDETFFLNQTGALNDAVLLKSQELAYSADGNYGNVSMKMPHAVLKLNLSALGKEGGTEVTIKADGVKVASVAGVTKASTGVYVAVPVEECRNAKRYEFVSIVGGASCNGWELKENTFYTLKNEDGAAIVIEPTLLPGKFSVSATEYVQFSRGNLFCTRSGSERSYTYEFAFEQNQYDYRCRNGKTNDKAVIGGNVDVTPSSTSGLFQWIPRNSQYAEDDWGAFSEHPSGLSDDKANDVLNFGDVFPGGVWKTLTIGQWESLIDNHKKGIVTVNGVKGLCIAPDNYDGEISSSYTPEQWIVEEEKGMVFLPYYGYYNTGTGYDRIYTDDACYWSSTPDNSGQPNYQHWAQALHFYNNGNAYNFSERWRTYGQNVRLVQKFNK